LWLSSGLFVAWLGWLLFLVLTTSRPIVLSRPQFLVSSHDIIAELTDADGKPSEVVLVQEVHWPKGEAGQKLLGDKLTVANLPETEGFVGVGVYILPLTKDSKGQFVVAPLPPSPGFDAVGRPRIYPLTDEARKQLEQIQKPDDLLAN
jgi:hypothetical protein